MKKILSLYFSADLLRCCYFRAAIQMIEPPNAGKA